MGASSWRNMTEWPSTRIPSKPNRASLQSKLEYERRREEHLKNQRVTVVQHVVYEDLIRPERLEHKLMAAGVPRIT